MDKFISDSESHLLPGPCYSPNGSGPDTTSPLQELPLTDCCEYPLDPDHDVYLFVFYEEAQPRVFLRRGECQYYIRSAASRVNGKMCHTICVDGQIYYLIRQRESERDGGSGMFEWVLYQLEVES